MPWIKLDDQIAHHPKFAAAGPVASWLFVCGLSYCARYLTDGFIPVSALPTLGCVPRVHKHACELVAAGLWHDAVGGYQVHDYHEYQPARVDAERRSEARRESGRLGGRRSGVSRRSKTEATTKQSASPQGSKTEANANPVPVPDPDPSKEQKDLTRGRVRKGYLYSGRRFDVTERMFENLTKGYGYSRVETVDWFGQFSAWDWDAEVRDLPIDNPLGWLRERITALMALNGSAATATRTDWKAECLEIHNDECGSAYIHSDRKALDAKRSA